MSLLSISSIILMLREHADRAPEHPDIRARGGLLAQKTFGTTAIVNQPELINFGTLALMQPRMTVYELSAGATRLVHSTDLHTLPGEPPRLLRTAWIIESRVPEREPLFGDTVSLAGYALDDSIFLIGLRYPDGAMVSRWRPVWAEKDLEAGITLDTSPLIDDADAHQEWTREAARFALVFGLLLDAERAPVTLREPKGKSGSKVARTSIGEYGWMVQRVILQRQRTAPGTTPQTAAMAERRLRDDLAPTTVPVTGHIKRQPYGPGRSQRKWIYVEGYEARRWIAPRPLRVVVTSSSD